MTIRKFNYFLLSIILGLLILVIIVPNNDTSPMAGKISFMLDNYLLGDVGFISLNRPFMSKVVAHYIALSIPVLGIAMHFANLIDFKKKTPIPSLILMFSLSIIGFYYSYFPNYLLVIPQRGIFNISPDSISAYLIIIIATLLVCSMTIPYIIFYFRKIVSKNNE